MMFRLNAIVFFIFTCNVAICSISGKKIFNSKFTDDSIRNSLQKKIDSLDHLFFSINQFDYDLRTQYETFYDDSLSNLINLSKNDSLSSIHQNKYFNLLNYLISNKISKLSDADSIFRLADLSLRLYDSLKIQKIAFLAKEDLRLIMRSTVLQIPDKRRNNEDSLYKLSENISNEVVKFKSGAYKLKFKNKTYRFFIVDTSNRVEFFYNNKRNGNSIEDIIKLSKSKPQMITNAGMFEHDFESVGLFIENGIIKHKIDTFRMRKGNFYMQPNGIFFIDNSGNFRLYETQDFLSSNYAINDKKGKSLNVTFATQSGPLLLRNSQFNNNLRFRSNNENIRNGVGIMNANKCVFIKTDEPVNFYDFAFVFKYFFRCESALYLDGAISKMYFVNINGSSDKNYNNDFGGSFGPMIAVYKKN